MPSLVGYVLLTSETLNMSIAKLGHSANLKKKNHMSSVSFLFRKSMKESLETREHCVKFISINRFDNNIISPKGIVGQPKDIPDNAYLAS